eukprot:364137-Chlamydomonas_euryale.AAC.7
MARQSTPAVQTGLHSQPGKVVGGVSIHARDGTFSRLPSPFSPPLNALSAPITPPHTHTHDAPSIPLRSQPDT